MSISLTGRIEEALQSPRLQRAYVELMMDVIGRGLVSTSEQDDTVRNEVAAFPVGYVMQMMVLPAGPAFTVEVQAGGTLKLHRDFVGKPDLCARFKHIGHAFLVFTFQEGTARAFANDRLYVDGDISHAIRLVRCLSRMEVLILPKIVAERAVKRYPAIAFKEKLQTAARIYGGVVKGILAKA